MNHQSSRDLPFSKKPNAEAIAAVERKLDRELERDPDAVGEPIDDKPGCGILNGPVRHVGDHHPAESALYSLLETAIAALEDAGNHRLATLLRTRAIEVIQ